MDYYKEGLVDNDYFDNLKNKFLNKYEKNRNKKNFIDMLFTNRLTAFQIVCNFIIV
jgi:hypothetical protein